MLTRTALERRQSLISPASPRLSLTARAASSEPKGCDLLIDSVSSAYDIPDNAHLLMTEEICLAVSSSHPLAHTGHISVEQMMDYVV